MNYLVNINFHGTIWFFIGIALITISLLMLLFTLGVKVGKSR